MTWAIGSKPSTWDWLGNPASCHFTSQLDTVNHVLSAGETHTQSVEVPVRTFDEVVGTAAPTLIKIDVEGYETEVLAGATRTLANPALHALILELNGSGQRYGFDENGLRQHLQELGFIACAYQPFARAPRNRHRRQYPVRARPGAGQNPPAHRAEI